MNPHTLFYRALNFLAVCYTLTVLLLFFSVADQALGHYGLLPASPTLLCVLLLAPFVIEIAISNWATNNIYTHTPGPLKVLSKNRSVLIPFLLLALLAVALAALPNAYWAEGGKWIFLIPYGLCITTCAVFLGQTSVIKSVLPIATLLSNVILALSLWYDTIYPGTFAPITNRAAGFPGNANFSSLVSVMLCAGGLNFTASKASAVLINLMNLLTTFAVVCMTMSRSGTINFASLLVLFLAYRFANPPVSSRARALEAVTLCVGLIGAVIFLTSFSRISSATQGNSRLTRLLNNQQVDDGSAGTRLHAIKEGIDLIELAPIWGHGTGHARTMSELPHNIYIQQWVNNGILGVLSYLGLLLSALATFVSRGTRNGVALVVVALIGGVFSHNILDQRPFLLLFGILLGFNLHHPQITRSSVISAVSLPN